MLTDFLAQLSFGVPQTDCESSRPDILGGRYETGIETPVGRLIRFLALEITRWVVLTNEIIISTTLS